MCTLSLGYRRHITHTFSSFLLFFLMIKKEEKKNMHVHGSLKILVDLKNCDLIFIGELKILNT
jgi:hypothetical protein